MTQENNLEYVKWLFGLDKNINIFSDEYNNSFFT